MLPENAKQIASELAALRARTNDDAYVIFEDAESGKFVQFAAGAGRPLLLDLPMQTLSQDEAARAAGYFEGHNEPLQEYDLLDQPGGQPAGTQRSYQMTFHEIPRATRIALEIFELVYLLPLDFPLRVERN